MGDTTGFSAKLIQQDVIAIKRNLVPTCAAALALLGGQATTVTTPVELGCAIGVELCGAKVAVPARKRCGWGTAVTSVKYVVSAWDDRSSQADTTYFTEVTAVPQPHRFRAGTATFAPHNSTPIAQPNSTGVVTVVAWPPSNAKAAAQVGTKFRLMAITSC